MNSYYELRQLFYYKVRHGLLQIATGQLVKLFLVAMIDLPPVLPVPTQHFRFHCLRKQWSGFLKRERNISSSLP